MKASCAALSAILLSVSLSAISTSALAADYPAPKQGDWIARDFKFHTGETMPELKLHYTTVGEPSGQPVLVLHGTGGSGASMLSPAFAGELFGAGQPLDASKYYIIIPDNIGHGKSSKPSDGMKTSFPKYDYDDMVEAQYQLLTQGLKVNHLRLVMGTSMGCMHSWVWAEVHPDFMDAVMPLACQPVEIAGRNRMMRKMIMDSIRNDPAWMKGEYKQPPISGLRSALYILLIMGSSPLQMQKEYPTREQADAFLDNLIKTRIPSIDANDWLYAFDASRNYDPSSKLNQIKAAVMFVNSADDQINPPELGIAEREIKRVKGGKFVLLPITDQTRGHGTHTLPAVWKQYLAELLAESQK
jgi:homoserine O-acetyltransferase/O-succinyltransferase